jgi:hypothetical protein
VTPLPASGSPSPGVLVEFAAAPGPESGGWVTRRAPVIFRAGRYEFADAPPFEMTPADIKAAAAGFEPVPLWDQHNSETSVFHGKLGELAAVEPSPDGGHVAGTVRVPKWLDDLFKGVALPLSATWDRVTKRLKNVALLTNPRIADARLEAAFAAAHAPPEATAVSTEVKPPPADADARLRDLERREAEWKAEREELKRQADRHAAQFAAERDKRLLAEAAAFAREQGAGFDAETKALLAEAYFSAAADDREHGEATFSLEGRAEPRKGPRLDTQRRLWAKAREKAEQGVALLRQDAYRGGAEFANDPGEKPGDEFKTVDAAVDAEIERQRKARQQTNGRG